MSLGSLVPKRVRGHELLDDPRSSPSLAMRSLDDIQRSNRWFGGTRAVLDALRDAWRSGERLALLDVGTGVGDIPAAARHAASAAGATLETIGIETGVELASNARAQCIHVCAADAMSLPFRDRSVDLVICSQVLHHFADPEAVTLLRELHRVARRRVVISEIRRSHLAAAGLWLASWPLGFHPVSRHDGVVSVYRGYRGSELAALVYRAVGMTPQVVDRAGFRVTASWSPQ